MLAAQIEEAVFEPDLLRIVLLVGDRHRQRRRRPQHFDLVDIDLDLAGRQIGIDRAFGPVAHLAVDAHHPFRAQLLCQLERLAIGIGHHLRDAVVVAQIDEQHATVVADAVAPARQPHGLADIAAAERAAGV